MSPQLVKELRTVTNIIGWASAAGALLLLALRIALNSGNPRTGKGKHSAQAPHVPQARPQLDPAQGWQPDAHRARWSRWSRRSRVTPVPPLPPEVEYWGPDLNSTHAAWQPPKPWERAHASALDGTQGLVRQYVTDPWNERQ